MQGLKLKLLSVCAVVSLGIASTAAVQAKDSIVIAIPGTPQGIDHDRQAGPQTWTLGAQVLELGAEWEPVKYPFKPHPDADPTKVPGFTYPNFTEQKTVPGIVEKCELSTDGKTAVYRLRKGVRSSAGNEFTAADVIYRVERAIANNAITAFIQRAVNAGNRDQWQIVDSHTVKITAPTPMPLICKVLTNPYFYWLDSKEAKKSATKDDPWSNNWVPTKGVGFGPYSITRWEPGRRVEMTANPHYWQGAPKIKKIIWQVVPESASRVALLKQGKVDLAEGLSPDEIVSFAGNKSVRGVAVRGNQSLYAVLNNKQAPFDKVEVRQVINMMIPRDKIVKQIYHGMAESWNGVMPSLYPGYVAFSEQKPDVAAAKALLAKAGYPNGVDVSLAYSAGEPVQESVAIMIQSALREVGIRTQLQKVPVAAHSDMVQSKRAAFALWVDFPIQPDPGYSIGLIYGSNNAVNYQNFSDAKVDQGLAAGVPIVNQAQRNKAHEEAQRIIRSAYAIGWIVEPHFAVGLQSNIAGWRWYTTQYYRVNDLSFN